MKITEATALIRTPLIEWARPQSWCDLGSGSGTFTVALAQLLAPGSTIYAIDLDRRTLEGIPDQHNGVEIRKIVGGCAELQSPSSSGRRNSHGKYAALHSRAAGLAEKASVCGRSLFDRGV
jgi:hypothetical protein